MIESCKSTVAVPLVAIPFLNVQLYIFADPLDNTPLLAVDPELFVKKQL